MTFTAAHRDSDPTTDSYAHEHNDGNNTNRHNDDDEAYKPQSLQ
jgi:hypothetical protein